MERLEAVRAFYEQRNEHERFACKHGEVEFLTTVHYIEKYLTPGMKILEIGAGTGRYSHYFARNGYYVDAIELVEHNIALFQEYTQPQEQVTIRQGDAIDLSEFASDSYDITLLLGPMYHLYTDEDKQAALCEAVRVTRPGGTVFAAYCNSDMTVYQFCFARGGIHSPQHKPLIDFDTFALRSTPAEIFALYRKEDVDALVSSLPVRRLHYVGADMLTHYIDDAVDAMDEDTFALYMKYHLSICERPDMVGATNHILDVLRKENQS